MRFKGFMRKMIDTGRAEFHDFDRSHFKEAGIEPQSAMPVLEAYQLVNRWNQAQSNQRVVYFLEA